MAEQRQKIELIVQEARAKQATAYEEQKLREDAERRARIVSLQRIQSITVSAAMAMPAGGII